MYTTPLPNWNPHGIEVEPDNSVWERDVRQNLDDVNIGMDGDTEDKAWSKSNPFEGHYHAPIELFEGVAKKLKEHQTEAEKANTGTDPKYVLDKNDKPQRVISSGNYIWLPHMKGVGSIRQRYPILPLHDSGSVLWKELKALEDTLGIHPLISGGVVLKLQGGGHDHDVNLNILDLHRLVTGSAITVDSAVTGIHTHTIKLEYDTSEAQPKYVLKECDGQNEGKCNDGHNRLVIIVDKKRGN